MSREGREDDEMSWGQDLKGVAEVISVVQSGEERV